MTFSENEVQIHNFIELADQTMKFIWQFEQEA